MQLTRRQTLYLRLQIQERELAAFDRQEYPNLNEMAITQRAIDGLRDRLTLYPEEGASPPQYPFRLAS